MNSNLVHNVLNVLIALLSFLTVVLLALGCTENSIHVIDCATATVDPKYIPWLMATTGILSSIKLIMNAMRDGLAGMAKPQPPVADQMKTVVLTAPADATVSVVTPVGRVTAAKEKP